MSQLKKWKQINSAIAYDSRYMTIRKDLVELPDGQRKEWTYWDSPDSALVIGMTSEKKIIIIKQYRYLVGDEVVEFPAGLQKNNETIEDCARREFQEETGYVCNELMKLGAFYETYGQLNRRIHLFFSKDVIKSNRSANLDDEIDEDTEIMLVEFEKAVELVINNIMNFSGGAAATLLLKEKISRGEILV